MRNNSWVLTRIGSARLVIPAAKKRLKRQTFIYFLALLVVLATVAAVYFLRGLLEISQVGYPAIAGLSFLASAGLVVPVPGIASVCAGGLLLNPLLVALVAGSTGTAGELTGYALGYSGRGMVTRGRLYIRIEKWMRRRGWLVLFLLSILPNPVFDLAGIAAGVLRFPIWGFLGIIWVGTFIKFLAVAYGCFFGVDSISKFFGTGITGN